MKTNLIIVLLLLVLTSGCSSLGSLPPTGADVLVANDAEGDAKSGIYEISQTFPRLERETAFTAARAGLVHADFEVVKIDKENEVVFGERAVTAFYWDFAAGIYIKELPDGVWIKLMVDGDAKRKKFARDIFAGIRLFVAAELENQINPQ